MDDIIHLVYSEENKRTKNKKIEFVIVSMPFNLLE